MEQLQGAIDVALQENGFLSAEVDQFADRTVSEYPRHHALGTELNRFCVELLKTPRAFDKSDQNLLALLLLARASQDFAAAMILANRGLRAQSRAMVRSTFETALHWAAACRNEVLVDGLKKKSKQGAPASVHLADAIEGGHQRFRTQTATELGKMPETPEDLASMLDGLCEELGPSGQHQDIELRGLALDLGLGDLYTVIYRPLSQDAHPSATSLQHHVIVEEGGRISGFRVGPDYDQYSDTVVLAICSLLLAVQEFTEHFGTPMEGIAVGELRAAYRSLAESKDA